ncbi:MAG: glycosyltransferase [Novosphingobium sp.]
MSPLDRAGPVRRGSPGGGQPLAGLRIGLLTAWASRAGGGVAEAVIAQAAMIRELGGEAPIFALDDAPSPEERARAGGSGLRLAPVRGPRQIGFAPGLAAMLGERRLDILHLHGIWMYPSRAGYRWTRATGRPYLVSPHGMLDPWITARGRIKKALARRVYERASWRAASRLHALTRAEADDIAGEIGRSDSLIIPNPAPPAIAAPPGKRAREFLYLGRIHPKKNLAALVEAWGAARAGGGLAGARLTLAGWGADDDVAALRRAVAGGPGVRFVGPAFGDAKQRLLAAARFVVLPSFSEGLPVAMLEAWAAATPTLMTEHCHLPEGFAAGAALPCPTDPAGIAAALIAADGLDEGRWRTMAGAAQALAAGPFGSATIAARWADAYRAALAA